MPSPAKPVSAPAKLKAYKVEWNSDEGFCEVVFASTSAKARAAVTSDYANDVPYTDRRAARAPEFDEYLGRLMTRVLLAHGWWHTCAGCDQRISLDDELDQMSAAADEGDPASESGAYYETANGALYHSEECCSRRYREAGATLGRQRGVALDAVERWPGIKVLRSTGHGWRASTAVGFVTFLFPGGRHPVDWERGDSTVSVTQVDADAWRMFSETCRASRQHSALENYFCGGTHVAR
jgi:hypothetical protein